MAPRKLPGLNGKRVLAALRRAGFEVIRVSGSHHVLVKEGQPRRKVILPLHGARDMKPGTLRSVLRQAGLSESEFMALL